MIRAVLDTNVIVSAFLSDRGAPFQVRAAWDRKLFDICTSFPLMEELQDVLRRPNRFPSLLVQSDEIETFLSIVKREAIFAASPLIVDSIIAADPDDDVVLATALATEADYIVSGDAHLLALGSFREVPIVAPRKFLGFLEERIPE